jgi:hypothetical protein
MEFQEYPKALYIGDAMRIVADATEERAARNEGYADWQAAHVNVEAPAADEESAQSEDPKPKRKYVRKES